MSIPTLVEEQRKGIRGKLMSMVIIISSVLIMISHELYNRTTYEQWTFFNVSIMLVVLLYLVLRLRGERLSDRKIKIGGREIPTDNLVLLLLLALPFLSYLYPGGSSYARWVIFNVFTLLLVTWAVVAGILGENLKRFGFQLGDIKTGAKFILVLFLLVLPVFIFGARRAEFKSYYPFYPEARTNIWIFFYYAFILRAVYMLVWEFFFRGYITFGLFPAFGYWTILIQTIPFGIMHIGKPMLEVYGSFITGAVLGYVAIKSKSFVPCFILHWLSAVVFDVLVMIL